MLTDKERRASSRRTANLNIRFTLTGQSDDRSACIENFSSGGMLLNSDTALQPGDEIHIRSAEGIPTDALLAWGSASASKVVFCRKHGKQDRACYSIGVRHHSPKGIHDEAHVPGPDRLVPDPIGCVTLDIHGKIIKANAAFAKMLACARSQLVNYPLARFVTYRRSGDLTPAPSAGPGGQ
jgi:hypothetical protein